MTTKYFTRLMQLVGIVTVATAIAVLGGSVRLTAKDKDVAKHEDERKDKDKDKNKDKDKDKDKDWRQNHERDDRDRRHDRDDHGDRDGHKDRGPRPAPPPPPPPPPSALSCPCWNTYTPTTLLNVLTSVAGTPWCIKTDSAVSLTADQGVTTLVMANSPSTCMLRANGVDVATIFTLTPAEATQCLTEGAALIPSLSWCTP